ncbi:MAG TPA: secondary thiamine-phosphate synthase enzyme YjbQ [Candidatus Binataceae bacterium]|nr:secondary thiamine-phosphate synthase enzyme YjbQ [Candidatus Binataceae bacterium]
MKEIHVKTNGRIGMMDITAQVNEVIAKSKVENGLCNLFTLHTTNALIVSENWDPDVTDDMLRQLQKLVPQEAGYKHSEGNSQAHILSVMLGTSINLPIQHGKLKLGRWQGVMLAELDGPRERTITVTVIASD